MPDDRSAERIDPAVTTEPTLVSVLNSYADAGFSQDMFVVDGGRLQCGACDTVIEPESVEVHSIRRLEGASDPADMSAVLAVVCPVCGAGATTVIRFGPEASADEARVLELTNDRRDSATLPPDATPSEA